MAGTCEKHHTVYLLEAKSVASKQPFEKTKRQTMRPPAKKAIAEPCKNSLNTLVKQLVANYQPVAVKQNSFFINDVPPHLQLHADKQVLATILGSVLYVTARCGRDTCIKLTAKAYHDVLLLHIVDT